MASVGLFETTDSVIDIIWDVAIAFFAVRLSLVYSVLIFSTSIALSHVLTRAGMLAAHPALVLLAAAAWVRVVDAWYGVPRAPGFRIAAGALSAALMAAARALAGLLGVRGELLRGGASGRADAGVLLAVAAMPLLVAGLERRCGWDEVRGAGAEAGEMDGRYRGGRRLVRSLE